MNIVIVGGGFAGIKAALELSKRQTGKVTLISNESYFLHHASLYATATGRNESESVFPLNDIFIDHPNVTVVKDKIENLDTQRRIVISKQNQYHYDTLILAMGSVTTYFNITGVAEHAFGIKSLAEVDAFQEHINKEVVERKLDKEYFVIGAGPTGVELAGALSDYLRYLVRVHRLKNSRAKVTLVEAAPRILPRSSTTASNIVSKRLKSIGVKVLVNHKVSELQGDFITIDGKQVPTTTAIWTSGVANNPFFNAHADMFHLAPNGRVNVNPYLEALPHVYVIGDNNSVKFSGMAWPAMQQGTYVAKHLSRVITKRPRFAFHPRSVMCGFPVGEGWGYVEWHGIYVSGKAGYWVRRWMELWGYSQLISYKKAVNTWRAHDISEFDEK
ncbi:MAG: FAD-dependent oxidoreductase [Candidatus Saccharimonadales bacterium]